MHRRDIEMIDAEAPPAEILAQAINSPHTRIPIFRGEPENIVGVIHAKDLSRAVHRFVARPRAAPASLEGFDVMDVAMAPYFVPESTTLDDQLREFLRRRTHFALVVDEYGALQGLVTLEDIIEEIVGDISDEHDVEEPAGIGASPTAPSRSRAACHPRLNRALDWTLPDEEANTIAGLVIHEAQSIPNPGQVFNFHGFRFEVLDREHNRLTRLRVSAARAEPRDQSRQSSRQRCHCTAVQCDARRVHDAEPAQSSRSPCSPTERSRPRSRPPPAPAPRPAGCRGAPPRGARRSPAGRARSRARSGRGSPA